MNKKQRNHVGRIATLGVIFSLSLATVAFAEQTQVDSETTANSNEEISTELKEESVSVEESVMELEMETESEIEFGVENKTEAEVEEKTESEIGPGVEIKAESEAVSEIEEEAELDLGPGVKTENESEEETETQAAEEVKPPYIQYTTEDIRILARTAYFEMEAAINRGDAEYVFKMTMSVILNRVTAPDFPNSVHGVVFSSGYAKRTQRLVNSGKVIPDVLYVWAEDVLKNGPNVPVNVIYQAGFRQGHGVYDVVLRNYFCYR